MAEKALTTPQRVSNLLTTNQKTIEMCIPQGFNMNRMHRTVINAISTTPKLMECTPASLFLASVKGFSMGLEPNGALNDGYLVPFWNKDKGCREAKFMPSYMGMIRMARRSGEIVDVYAGVVREGDHFEEFSGVKRGFEHKPKSFSKEPVIGFYAAFNTSKGGFDYETMSLEDVERIRNRSKSKDSGPWVTDFNEMGKKTVLKRLLKRAPMSVEERTMVARATQADHQAAMGEEQTFNDVEGLKIPDEDKDVQANREANAKSQQEDLAERMQKKKEDAGIAEAEEAEHEPVEPEPPADPPEDLRHLIEDIEASYADYENLHVIAKSKDLKPGRKASLKNLDGMDKDHLIKYGKKINEERIRLKELISEVKAEPEDDPNYAF
jgi:recombination protein RecT